MPDTHSGHSLDSLLTAFKGSCGETKLDAVEHLARHPATAATIPLLQCFAGADDELREALGAACEELGAPQDTSLPELQGFLADPDPDAAYWAATLIGRLGPAGAAALEQLAQATSAERAIEVRQRAVWAIGQVGVSGERVRQALRIAAEDEDPRLARLASELLGK